MNSYAVVLASGSGTRFGATDVPKHLISLNGVPLLIWTLQELIKSDTFSQIVVVAAPENLDETNSCIEYYYGNSGAHIFCVTGAKERMGSFMNGYRCLSDLSTLHDLDVIVLVDANRPFVESTQLSEIVRASSDDGCACLARPLINGVARTLGSMIIEVPEKSQFVEFVTPEGIRSGLLSNQLSSMGPTVPSLVDLALKLEVQPSYIGSNERNAKLTYPEDLHHFEALQRKYNIEPPNPMKKYKNNFAP